MSEWYYDSPRTVAGALQRGLGRGAVRAGPDDVFACVRRDYRWNWSVDERAVYLARLVRDLRLPVGRLVDLLREDHGEDDDNAFGNTREVLTVLGRAGDPTALDALPAYVRDGPGWLDVLHDIAHDWPRELWDDLLPLVAPRMAGVEDMIFWAGPPWTDWAERDGWIAARVAASRPGPPRPVSDDTVEDLLAAVRTGDRAALRELDRRGPQPALLDLADAVPADLHGSFGSAVCKIGAPAVPHARTWAARPEHPLFWSACLILAEHGDESDGPALLRAWAWLDGRDGMLCGFEDLAKGFARIGVRAGLPKLRRAWCTPHTFERAAYLRALVALDPGGAERFLTEGLWDCEGDVREFAAAHVPLSAVIRRRLDVLRDDPMETPEVRAAAAARIGGP
ncbi:hypothetical protein ACFO1B_28770 [Dactylosporangium siamense]|uniref:hypothetical protein n=1 Tax=Dactylosporangium siamense TaxID=685454 RepID=UPI00194567CB|nr:hypothetical protein [Dactylosporangium siamense]